jgi:hypothetical protein
MNKIARHLDGDADELLEYAGLPWQYNDPVEHEAWLRFFRVCGVHIGRIDAAIESGELTGPNVMPARARLLRLVIDGKDDEARNLGERFLALTEQNHLAMGALRREVVKRKASRAKKSFAAQQLRAEWLKAMPVEKQKRIVDRYDEQVRDVQKHAAREVVAAEFGLTTKQLDVLRKMHGQK